MYNVIIDFIKKNRRMKKMKELLKKILWLLPWLGNMIYKKELRVLRNSRYFDDKYYYFLRPDVFKSRKDAALHYLLYGWNERVNPSEYFNTAEYLNAYSDVNFNPLLHYEWFGKNENRNAGIKPFPTERISFLQDETRNARRQTAEIQLTVQEEILKRNNAKQIEELKKQLLDITNSLQSKLQEQQNAFESKLEKLQLEQERTFLNYQKSELEKAVVREENTLKLQRDLFEMEKQISEQNKQIAESNNKSNTCLTNIENQKKHIEELKKKYDWRDSDIRRQMNYLYYKGLHPDQYKENLKEWYKSQLGEELDLENPQNFNEKIQWLKLYDSNPLKTQLADKYLVREWVKDKIGEKYLIPLLGVWNDFDDINFNSLPQQFALKANHGCAYNVIVKDKTTFNKDDARNKFKLWLRENFAFKFGLEMHYKNIQPKIIAEEYLENIDGEVYDYKIFCFNGKAKYIQIILGRSQEYKMVFFDTNWIRQDFVTNNTLYNGDIPKPKNLSEMLEKAEILAKDFNFVRVDFYILNDNSIKFGEMTFTPFSGVGRWNKTEWNTKFGEMIKLPMDRK